MSSEMETQSDSTTPKKSNPFKKTMPDRTRQSNEMRAPQYSLSKEKGKSRFAVPRKTIASSPPSSSVLNELSSSPTSTGFMTAPWSGRPTPDFEDYNKGSAKNNKDSKHPLDEGNKDEKSSIRSNLHHTNLLRTMSFANTYSISTDDIPFDHLRTNSRIGLYSFREGTKDKHENLLESKTSSLEHKGASEAVASSSNMSEYSKYPETVNYHKSKMEKMREEQLLKFAEKEKKRKNTISSHQNIPELNNLLKTLEKIPFSNIKSNSDDQVQKRLSIASLLYQTQAVIPNDIEQQIRVYDERYKHVIQMEVGMSNLIQLINNFQKAIQNIITVASIRNSDTKLKERSDETNSDPFPEINPESNEKINIVRREIEIEEEEENREEGEEDDPDDSELQIVFNDNTSQTVLNEENFENEEINVSSEENFLLNVNPSDKIQFCTLDQLIEKCFVPLHAQSLPDSHDEGHNFYIRTLSTSFSTFLHMYNTEDIISRIENIIILWRFSDERIQVISRVITFFSEWIFYCVQSMNKRILDRILGILKPYLHQADFSQVGSELIDCLFNVKQVLFMKERAQLNILRTFNEANTFDILKIDMLKLCMELTLIEFDLFQMLQPQEFFFSAWMKPNKAELAPNLVVMIKCYNVISEWVVRTILQYKEIDMRYKVLCRFISLAWNCVSVRNYNGCFAIIAGLYTTPIQRLKKTWSMLNDDYSKIVEKLMYISSVSANYKNYRNELQKAKTPCIPNIAVHLKDFASLDDAQVNHADNDPSAFNISKRNALSVLVRSLLRYQKYPFLFKSNATLRNNLWSQLLNIMSDTDSVKERTNRLLNISRELEPPPKK